MTRQRFIALLPVRDEGDIIRQCLSHALTWADAVFVYDTGSVDDTYETVLEMARADSRIHPIGSEPTYYNENRVRGLLFNSAREFLRDGDWFLRMDADEFHHVRPQDFVATRLDPCEGIVYHQYFDFHLTLSEVGALATKEAIAAERLLPISERRRHYTASVYAEPRMCRYRSSMRWPLDVSFPYNAGLLARERLPIRHYPHRDPRQLDRRCRLRAIMMSDRENRATWGDGANHWTENEWSKFVVDDLEPSLKYWEPGTDLPEVKQTNHLATGAKRQLQRAIYRLGLPRIMDMTRAAWTGAAHPLPIALETQETLQRELGHG